MSFHPQDQNFGLTATDGVLIGSTHIGNLDRISIQVTNSATTALDNCVIEASNVEDLAQIGGDAWVEIPSAIIGLATAVAASGSIISAPFDSSYKFVRLVGRQDASAASAAIGMHIHGHVARRG